jgi:hypothetical protein
MTSLLQGSRRLVALLVLPLGLALAVGPATSASASPDSSERARNYYGSIALSVDGGGGLSYDYRTKAKAIKVAKSKCKRKSNYPGRCRTAVWVRNGCAAVSVKRNADGFITRYGWAVRRYKGPAISAAKHKCGSKCKRYAWVCTTRP